MKVVECRSCGSAHRIKPIKFQESEYPDGLNCYKCWSPAVKPKGTSVNVGGKYKSTGSGYSPTSTSYNQTSFPTAKDARSGLEVDCKYEVGDSVFINTDKYGVLLCQILDSEAWGVEHIFYTLDAKGTSLDYIEEDEMYDTAAEANSCGEIHAVS
jgi:hypothetical protein